MTTADRCVVTRRGGTSHFVSRGRGVPVSVNPLPANDHPARYLWWRPYNDDPPPGRPLHHPPSIPPRPFPPLLATPSGASSPQQCQTNDTIQKPYSRNEAI